MSAYTGSRVSSCHWRVAVLRSVPWNSCTALVPSCASYTLATDDIQTELGKKGATTIALASLLAANEDKEQKARAVRLLLNLAFIGAYKTNAFVAVRNR